MSLQLFINPKHTERLYPLKHLAGGESLYIDVKKFLSAREEQQVRTSGIPHLMSKASDADLTEEERKDREVKMGLDMGRMKIVRAASYIVGWNFPAPNGEGIAPLNEHSIGEMTPQIFDAIDKALDDHKAAVEKEKNVQSGAPIST